MVRKTKGQELADRLLTNRKSILEAQPSILKDADEFCEGYKEFLSNKTEREVVDYVVPILEGRGYREYSRGMAPAPGDKFYMVNRGKTIIMCTKGRRPIAEGVRVAVAHIDSPRLDFKPHPLFEDAGMAFFKTHYYGGIKKYQWTTVPMSLRGVVYTRDGRCVKIRIGEEDDEPSFVITDLLPHLAQNQMKKGAGEVVEGEQLNVLIGSRPYGDEKVKDRVKLEIMRLLNEAYGITEDDFETAELCAVPAFKPRDLGLDRSMVAGYGQDDSSCAYAEFMAELDTVDPEFMTVTIFADKEETGSDGVTGMRSFFFRDFLEDLAQDEGAEVRDVLRNSICLSCDVSAGFDPAYPEVMERNNCCYMNMGPCIAKYDGARGKAGTNDASAEMMDHVISILRDAGVTWQIGELGRIDLGGGGTIASEISVHNIDTVDIGVPVLSMHAPVEVTAKADVYMLYKAIRAVYDSREPKGFRSKGRCPAPSPSGEDLSTSPRTILMGPQTWTAHDIRVRTRPRIAQGEAGGPRGRRRGLRGAHGDDGARLRGEEAPHPPEQRVPRPRRDRRAVLGDHREGRGPVVRPLPPVLHRVRPRDGGREERVHQRRLPVPGPCRHRPGGRGADRPQHRDRHAQPQPGPGQEGVSDARAGQDLQGRLDRGGMRHMPGSDRRRGLHRGCRGGRHQGRPAVHRRRGGPGQTHQRRPG